MEMARYGVTVQRDRAGRADPHDRERVRQHQRHVGRRRDESFDFWHPDNVAPLVAYLCSDAAAHISGKVFGVQGDAVELYQPFTSAAVIQNDDTRWTRRASPPGRTSSSTRAASRRRSRT